MKNDRIYVESVVKLNFCSVWVLFMKDSGP